VLDVGDRTRRHIALTAESGTIFLPDLEKPVTLLDGVGLVLDDGTIVGSQCRSASAIHLIYLILGGQTSVLTYSRDGIPP
jgi:hypothetical protein